MKITISGYGKMGKEIEKAAIKTGHDIVAIVDNHKDWDEQLSAVKKSDVIIDFSLPAVAVEILLRSFYLQIPIITGTTGWYDHLDEVIKKCKEMEATLFYAPNFSIGVNIFFKLNRDLAIIMDQVDGYKVKIKETHHMHKLDAPSGTAIKAGEDIIKEMNQLKSWVNDYSENSTQLPIFSKRKGSVTGTHKVIYTSEMDKIELVHKAKNRSAFANGAILAAAFVKDKQGVFTMEDLLNFKT